MNRPWKVVFRFVLLGLSVCSSWSFGLFFLVFRFVLLGLSVCSFHSFGLFVWFNILVVLLL